MSASIQQNGQIWNGLHAIGLNDIASSGVMGNMSQESSMNPNEAGGGLMQWINGRWTALVNYANAHGEDPHSVAAQVGWFGQEVKAGNEGITLQGLNSQHSPADAALYVSTKYERPNPAKANNANRESKANQFYTEFSGKSTAGFGQPSSSSPPGSSTGAGLPGLTQTGSSPQATTTNAKGFPSGSDIIQIIDQSMTLKDINILKPSTLVQDAGAIAVRTVLVLIGLILFIFGLVALVEKVAPGTPVPIPV